MPHALNCDDYTVAWIAVLHIEASAAIRVLDNLHDGYFESVRGDEYLFTAGDINGHNVVIATLPTGYSYGIGAAAALATSIKSRFPNLWFTLLVGVAAGLPNAQRDIRLGDVLVAVPNQENSGIIQYDLGKDTEQGFLPQTRSGQTPTIVLSAISQIRLRDTNPFRDGSWCAKVLSDLCSTSPTKEFFIPRIESDVLYQSSLDFSAQAKPVARKARDPRERTCVWYGTVGSGNRLMRHPEHRDELRDRYDIIGLEMEAAGVSSILPTAVIRGVCDYGDGFKNKTWQPYAAAAAAVYAKGILYNINLKTPSKLSSPFTRSSTYVGESSELSSPLLPHSISIPKQDHRLAVTDSEFEYTKSPGRSSLFPYERNSAFVSRDLLTKQLMDLLELDSKAVSPGSQNRIALYGLAGVGKTQLAVDFTYQYQDAHSDHTVYWLNAKSGESLHQSLAGIMLQLKDGMDSGDAPNLPKSFTSWLRAQSSSWIVIIDSADDMEILFDLQRDFLELLLDCPGGTILVTTQNKTVATRIAGEKHSMEVPSMTESEALLLLKSRFISKVNLNDARHVCQLLGNLPLALVQAATFVRENGITLSKYAEVWTESSENAQQLLDFEFTTDRRDRNDPEVPNAVAAALMLTLNMVLKRNPYAAEVISLMSFYNHSGLPEDLLIEDNMTVNNIKLVAALGELSALSLISRKSSSRLLEMHRLVHMVTFMWQKKGSDNTSLLKRAKRALGNLNRVFPQAPSKIERPQLDLYLPHAIAFMSSDQTLLVGTRDNFALQRKVADHLLYQGRTLQAAAIRNLVLRTMQKTSGISVQELQRAKYELAAVFEQQRHFDQAKAICQDIIAQTADEHRTSMTYINTLILMGTLLAEEGLYSPACEALAIARERVEMRSQKNIEDVIKIEIQEARVRRQAALSLAPAQSLERKELLAESKGLLLQATSELRAQLGAHASSYIVGLQYLTRVLDDLGDWQRSEDTYKLIVRLKMETLGQNHLETFRASRTLATFYSNRSRTKEAETIFQELRLRIEAVLGSSHPEYLRTLGAIAQNLKKRAEMHHAEVEAQTALIDELKVRIMGNEQNINKVSLRAQSSSSIAEQLAPLQEAAPKLQSQLTEAQHSLIMAKTTTISAFRKVIDAQQSLLSMTTKILGLHQPETLEVMSDLARTIQRAHLLNSFEFSLLIEEAEQLLRTVLKHQLRIHKQELDHEDILSAQTLLAAFFHQQQRYQQAESLEREVLQGERKKHGDRHVRTLAALQALAETMAAQNTPETWRLAVGFLEKCVEISLVVLGKDHREYKERSQLLDQWKTEKLLDDGSASSQRSIRIMQHYERTRALRPSTILETPRFSMSRTSQAPHFQEASFNEQLLRGLRVSSMYHNHGLSHGLEDHESPFVDEEDDSPLSEADMLTNIEHQRAHSNRYRHYSVASQNNEDQSLFEMD